MRDAAGEPAERFQPLRLAQRRLGGFAAIGFRIKISRALSGQAEQREEQERGGNAEDQMAADARQPFIPNLGGAQSRHDIDRESLDPAIADAALEAVELTRRGINPALAIGALCNGECRLRHIELRAGRGRLGITREKGAILPLNMAKYEPVPWLISA